jgi:hypothetical protein
MASVPTAVDATLRYLTYIFLFHSPEGENAPLPEDMAVIISGRGVPGKESRWGRLWILPLHTLLQMLWRYSGFHQDPDISLTGFFHQKWQFLMEADGGVAS